MRLLDTHSVMGHVWTMTFSHALCWKVKPERSWTHPLPDGVYDTHIINHQQLSYRPPMHWKIVDQYSLATVEPHKLSERLGVMPSWSAIVTGHDIKVYIPALPVSSASDYADIKCCIDGECHHPDVEQWFRKLKGSTLELPIVHFKDLDPFQEHHISMTALPRQSDSGGAVIAVSRIVYEQFTVEAPPLIAPLSPEPIESPTPSQPKLQIDIRACCDHDYLSFTRLLFSQHQETRASKQQTREAQYPDHQEQRTPGHQDRSTESSASAPNQSISYTQTSRPNPQSGSSDEPRPDEPVLTLPDPFAATGSGPVPGDDVSQHELASSASDFTVGSDELTSTPPGSNWLALSVGSSSSPHTRPLRIHSLQDRRPLTPIDADVDYESPFGEQSSPPPVFTGLHTPIPPFVRPTFQGDSADSPRSSSLYGGQTFETESTYEHIGTARDHSSLGIDEAPSSSEGDAQRSSERVVDVRTFETGIPPSLE
ncbi:hypothetical protein FS837_010469 [Tulasnella sp. UAMH 9824]|nr:hypothetical protein FS837_010469 [Tulasnella sp. UAMH 9824]